MEIVGIVVIWVLSGMWSFKYWWTQDFNLTTQEIPLMIFIGVFGPIGYVMGYFLHHKKEKKVNTGTVIFQKRGDDA